jgi:hypothetical protein
MTLETLNSWEKMQGFPVTDIFNLPENYEEEDLLQIYEDKADSLNLWPEIDTDFEATLFN